MASESIVNSSHGMAAAAEDKQASEKITDQSESRNDSERGCDETTSGDDDWSDEFGKLVIDLGNDNDPDKSGKDAKSSGRSTPVSNVNNNNSVSSSPSKHGGSLHDKNSSKSSSKTSLSRSSSPSSGKTSKPKAKKSKSSSNKHQNAASPSGSSGEIVAHASSGSKQGHSSSGDGKSGATTSATASAPSPEEASSKKNKSKSNRSHHKKHSKQHDKGQSGNGKGDGEKIKSKPKHSSSANTNSAASAAGFAQTAGSHFLPPHVAPVPAASHAQANKHTSARRSASPSVTSQPSVSATASKSHQGGTQGRQPSRTAVMPTSSLGGKASAQQMGNNDKEQNSDQTSGQHAQSSRKKHRKGPHGVVTAQGNNSSGGSEAGEQYGRAYPPVNAPVQGKRERSGLAATHAPGMDGSGPKKIKLDTDTKRSGKEGSSSTRSSPDRNETARIVKTSTSSGSNPPQNGAQIPATPPVFAPSSLFATSTIPHYSGALAHSGASQTSSVWSRPVQHGTTASTNTSSTMTSSRTVGTLTCTSDIGVMTEPDVLGPCEPGTNVHLDGIVWHETDTGVLVVNVTWRNRTYVGTLLDATKHDWAPPRFSDSDVDMELRGKNGRPKRLRNGANEAPTRKGRSRGAVNDDIKGSPSSAAKKRGSKTSESEVNEADGASTPKASSKRARLTSSRNANNISQQLQQLQNDRSGNASNGGSGSSTCSSPVFIECPHPNCSKKYKHANGLKYHQAHAHLDYDENDVKDDVTNHVDEGDERITDSESNSKRENPRSEKGEASPPPAPVAMDTEPVDQSATEVAAATKTQDGDPGARKEPHLGASPYARSGGAQNVGENLPISKEPSTTGYQRPSTDAGSSAADSENELAVKNLLLQFGDREDQVLPGLTAPYSQDSPAPTLSLSRPEYVAPATVPVGNLRETPASEYHPFVSSSETQRPVNYQKSSPIVTKQDTPATMTLPTSASKVPTETVTSSALVSALPPSGGVQNVHQLSVSIHSSESCHVSGGSIHYTASEYPSGAVAHPSGVKTAKGKTVPIPVGPTQSLIPPGNITSPNSAKKSKPRKKKAPGEGGEIPSSVKQETSHPGGNIEGVGSGPVAFQGGVGDNVAGIHPRAQQPVARPPQPQEGVTLGAPGQGQPIKSEPGARYPQSFPQQHPGAPRRVQGVVTTVPSSSGPTTHNVTVAGTFHPFPDPHKPQTAVSAQAQDRLRASRAHSPTSASSSNKNNNNKLAGSRSDQGQPLQAKSRGPVESGEAEGNYRGKYPDPKPRPSLDHHHEHAAIKKMQDKVVSTVNNEYRHQTSRPKQPASAVDPQQRHHEAAPTRSLSPQEGARQVEERPRQRPVSPARPRVKELPSTPRDGEPRQAKTPGDAQFAANPQLLAQHMPLYSYPYFLNPAAAAGFEQHLALSRMSYEQLFQDLHKQQQLALQQQKTPENRPRKPAEAAEKLPIKPEPTKAVGPPSQSESAHEKTALWVANQAKRHSTGAISPFPNQPSREKGPFQTPVHPQHPQGASHTRYKSPQPSQHQTPTQTPGSQQRPHSVAPVSASGGHRRTESGERPHRRSEVKEEVKSTPIRKQSTPTPQQREGKSPEKSKEMAGGIYRSSTGSPGHLQYYPAAPGGPYPALYDPSRPPYRGVPYAMPGYVYPTGAPIYPTQPGWVPPGSQAPNHGKQSPPLKEPKERPASVPRSPKEDRSRVEAIEQHHNFTKERAREGPPSRKASPSPDPKQGLNVPPASTRIPTSNPGDQRIPSPPTQRHLHTHHHIHEGVPFNQFIPPPQHYPYPAAIPPPAVLAANGEAVAAAVYPPTAYNQKRD